VLFDGLIRQSEINRMLDELFVGDLGGTSPNGVESVIFTLGEEEREWEYAEEDAALLIA
jgi:hypothetical protein